MAISGSCLCGGVRFVVDDVTGSSEICHCVRCQKKSGATSLTMIDVDESSYQLLSGDELIQSYEAPVLNRPPAYSTHFCRVCGSPVPLAVPGKGQVEIPAGLFDYNPGVKPNKHIFVDFMHDWDEISDDLPQYDLRALIKERWKTELPEGFELIGQHDGATRTV